MREFSKPRAGSPFHVAKALMLLVLDPAASFLRFQPVVFAALHTTTGQSLRPLPGARAISGLHDEERETAHENVIAILRVTSIGFKPIFDAARHIIGFSFKIAACLHAGIPLEGAQKSNITARLSPCSCAYAEPLMPSQGLLWTGCHVPFLPDMVR